VTEGDTKRTGRTLAVSCALVLMTFAVYGQLRSHGFVNFDDDQYVYANPNVRGGLSAAGLRYAFGAVHSSNWHPLTTLSHQLDSQLFGLDAGAHHLTSVLLHAANAVLLFLALRALARTPGTQDARPGDASPGDASPGDASPGDASPGDARPGDARPGDARPGDVRPGPFWPSALVAALFALHPLRVESVAWASERKDVVSGLFWMLALLAYARHARAPSLASHARVTLCLVLGMLAKPMVVTLPLVFVLLDFWPLRRPVRRAVLREKLPWFALSAVLAAVTFAVQSSAGSVRTIEALPLDARIAGALEGYGTYVLKTFVPGGLAFFHPHPAIVGRPGFGLADPRVLGSALLLLGASLAAWRLRGRAPWVSVGWAWFLVTLAPVIGIVQVGEQAWAERYAYLPTIGLYVALAWSAAAWIATRTAWRPAAVLLSGAALLACAALTRRQAATWRDEQALYGHALRVTRENYHAHNNLGLALLDDGDVPGAAGHFREATRIRPGDERARVNLAIALAASGDLPRARAQLEELVRLRPGLASAHGNLASVLARQGERALARDAYARAIELDPTLPGPHANLGLLLLGDGEPGAALASLERALALEPDHVDALVHRGVALARVGREEEAVASWRRALRLDPGSSLAANHLAWTLATSTRAELRDGAEALRLAEALARVGSLDPATLFPTVAAVRAELGDFEAAERALLRALETAPPERRPALAGHLERVRARLPMRSPRSGADDPEGDS